MKKIYAVTGILTALLLSSLTTFAQSQSREDLFKEIEAKRKELAALEKSFLSPTEEDRLQHAEFLRTPDSGLFRLLPREKYDSNVLQYNRSANRAAVTPGSVSRTESSDLPQGQLNVEDTGVRAKVEDGLQENYRSQGSKLGLTLRGGGAYYSFSQKTHEYGYGSDIELNQGKLMVGFAGADYGLMANIGNVPLENVTLASPEANVLATYKPATEEPQARLEYRRIGDGTEIDGLKVNRRLPLRSNATYLLRSLNYGASDVLVAFRVVRVDSDGSAIILWKLLKKYKTPQLARN
jgi:hypothetical protein